MDKGFIVTPEVVTGQMKLVAKSAGLNYITPKFFKINEDQARREGGFEEVFYDKISVFGQPLFDTFSFLPTRFIDIFGKEVISDANLILDSCLIEVNQPKNIITTEIQGVSGSIKEWVSNKDYEIKVNGLIVGKLANSPPEVQTLLSLEALLNAPVALPVASTFLDFLRINTAVVKSYSFAQMEGVRNAYTISIDMISDEPYEIRFVEAEAKQRTFSTFGENA